MEVSREYIQTIADELVYVAKKMREEKELLGKIYYLSGSYAVVQRVMNIEYDDDLVLIHRVLMDAYTTINNRLNSIISGQERVIKIPVEVFDALADCVEGLSKALSEKKDFRKLLAKIATIGYIGTGNGYYLYQKGLIKL